MSGAEGGSRTRTTLRSTDFKSVASAIPPPRHRARKNSTAPNSRQTNQVKSKIQTSESKVLKLLVGKRRRTKFCPVEDPSSGTELSLSCVPFLSQNLPRVEVAHARTSDFD